MAVGRWTPHIGVGSRRRPAGAESILDRTSRVDVGALCLSYGGGGHKAAGTCQIDNARAEAAMAELVGTLTAGR